MASTRSTSDRPRSTSQLDAAKSPVTSILTNLPTYVSKTLGMDIDETTELRASLILSTTQQYEPDILIVDKEPTGFRGELLPTLELMQNQMQKGCSIFPQKPYKV